MKNLKNYILSFALLATSLTGCNDFLDLEPKSVWESGSFYKNRQEMEIALAGIYRVIASDQCYGQVILFLDAGTDEAYFNRRTSDAWQVSINKNNDSYADASNFWAGFYQAINLTNLFIESADNSSMEVEEYNQLVAEARFLRAFSYFNLTNFWNEVPLRLTSSKDQTANNQPKATLAQLYQVIIEDLEFASEHLPNPMASVPGRANNMAAHGLLARLYLKMSGFPFQENHYQDALNHCMQIINSGYHSLIRVDSDTSGYEKVFKGLIGGIYNTNEVIWEISYQNLRDIGLVTDGSYGNLNGLNFGTASTLGDPNGFAMYGVMPTLTNLYDKEYDKRFLWNTPGFYRRSNGDIRRATELQITNFCPGKFRRWEPSDYDDLDINTVDESYEILEDSRSELNRNFTAVNFPVLRYSDVLLMAAEAENQLNGPAGALPYINSVRLRAGLDILENAAPAVAGSKSLFQDEIVDERSRELCFENLRKFDLVRWGILDQKLQEVKLVVEGHVDFNPADLSHTSILRAVDNFDPARHLSLPYPLFEVMINQDLDQKDEWK